MTRFLLDRETGTAVAAAAHFHWRKRSTCEEAGESQTTHKNQQHRQQNNKNTGFTNMFQIQKQNLMRMKL